MEKVIIDYNTIISLENLYEAWKEFVCGKKNKEDVALFSLNLSSNIFNLLEELKNKTYKHSPYKAFAIYDPKPRSIHKATVKDRLLHHAIYRKLYPHFDRIFIYDSYSCRVGKGTHKALKRFKIFARKVSKNNTKTAWILKCDIRKFFASIDHEIRIDICTKYIHNIETLTLIKHIVHSFYSTEEGRGLPLGNLTSQLLVNIYMNELDQFVKHKLRQTHYIRYADDFVFIHHDKNVLFELLPRIQMFLKNNLKFSLHPKKVFIKTLASGVDFLGWVHFPTHKVLRTATKRRMMRNLHGECADDFKKTMTESYVGMLKQGNAYKITEAIMDIFFL